MMNFCRKCFVLTLALLLLMVSGCFSPNSDNKLSTSTIVKTFNMEGLNVLLGPVALFPDSYGLVAVTLPYNRLSDDFTLLNNTQTNQMSERLSLSDDTLTTPKINPESVTYPTSSLTPKSTPTPEPIPIVMPQNSEVDYSKPMVALTFDDGPNANTNLLLDILEAYNARATFCVIGQQVSGNAAIIERAVALGSEIIGHSWDHINLTKLSKSDILWQLDTTNDAIASITGVNTQLFRAPYGAVNDEVEEAAREAGYAIIFWSVDPLDWKSRDANSIYKEVTDVVKNGDIILSHDIYMSTVDAYERIIPELIRQGYQLVTVSELLAGRGIEVGNTYNRR